MRDICQTIVVEDGWCALTEQEQEQHDVTDVVELLAEIWSSAAFPLLLRCGGLQGQPDARGAGLRAEAFCDRSSLDAAA